MTGPLSVEPARIRPARRSRFFVWIAIAMLVVAALGFGKSFYLRPMSEQAPLPTYLVVHGVVMTLWYLFFLSQAILAQRGSLAMHRRLGIAGVALAAGVVVTGASAHLGIVPRMQALGHLQSADDFALGVAFALEGLASLLPFIVLIALAVWLRRNSASHKRLMYWALAWTLGPALSNTRPLGQFLDSLVVPHLPFFPFDLLWFAALLVYDWRTLGRIHPVTWLGFVLLALHFLVITPWILQIVALHAWLGAYLGGG